MVKHDQRLEPCPFCGAPAEYELYNGVHYVRCSAGFPCGAEIGQDRSGEGTKRGVFRAWNRREEVRR